MTQYVRNPPLTDSELPADPLALFGRWLADAEAAGQIEPTAMALATVGQECRPSLRVVLFKGLHEGGLCFYTCYASRKGRELAARPHAAATFWWDRLERQVRLEGCVERLPRELSQRYFRSRPRGSQLSAYTSRQSQALDSRAALEARVAENARRFSGQEIPLPEDWGGYRLVPESIEFWQGRLDRLHDRVLYRREQGAWRRTWLEP
jgi:pyridoxamine 5'-phosphate oxidase